MSMRSLAVLAALPLLLTACSGSEDTDATGTDPGAEPTSETSDASAGAGTCTYEQTGGAAREVSPPPAEPDVSGDVEVTLHTNVGDLDVTLDAASAPCTVNSFLSLAEQGYYDDTSCHRLTTAGIFVLQCGDPTGSGMGGPGYQFDDELSGQETYDAGTLAMANAGPGTNGSQFFIVYDDTQLPPNYTVFGTVGAQGLEAVRDVAKKGTDNGQPDGAPKQPVTITGVES